MHGLRNLSQKVRFVNICHRHWLSSARGFPREFPSGHSGTSGMAVPLPLCCYTMRGPRNARGVLGCALRFRPRDSPRLYTLHSTPYTAALLPTSTPAEGAQPAHRALYLAQRLNCGRPLHSTFHTLNLHNFNNFCDFICPIQKNVVYLRRNSTPGMSALEL